VLVVVALAAHAHGRVRVLLFLLAAALGAELLLTETRGAWIAAIVGILVIGAVLDRRLLLAALVTPVLLVAFVPSVAERVTSTVPDPSEPRTESSLTWRLEHWTEVLPMVDESPITGVGLGETDRRTGKQPHNDFLLVLVEMGIVGMLVYLWFLGAAVVTGFRATRRVLDRTLAVEPIVEAVTVALFGYAIAFIVASSGENLLENVTALWVVFPAFAAVSWVAAAPRLGLVRARRTPGRLRARLAHEWTRE
jgi:putative inorganic carbon (hco3(-)) transporter